ncbi:MAG TPA: ATP-dependent DNA helicase UvrD2 [Acidimicrobiales bacterium]|nr:ATP-dependent DNA helicase UvrD2 [Acidimicrobiales bacterium]
MTAPGPELLARNVVVVDGAEPPAAWAGCPVVRVDDDALARPAAAVEQLHAAWAGRRRVVVDLRVDPVRFRRPVSYTEVPWELTPTFEPWLDRLHFLVWHNSYDARTGEPIWWWGRKAARLGGTATDQLPDGHEPVAGDLVLPDGTPAWVDGGPPDDVDPATLAPAVLIRAESVDAGHLHPVPAWTPPTADLAPDQLAAVSHRGGPARIIAPAGSGKTRVLTERLRHLLADRGHERQLVLAVAYNRKAQEEMAVRTEGLGARIQTLNALGYEIVGRHVGRRPPLLDEREVRRRLEPHLPKLQHRLNTDPMAPYLEGLSVIRLGLRDPDEVELEADAPGLAAAVEPYRDGLRRDGVLDFDEQILRAVELLLADGEFRRQEQDRHRHLLVDEFQDLTPAHVLLLRLLAAPTYDVFGVGDDDQCIYGHAGASPQFLLRFADLFPGAHEHALEVNYRCPPAVVDAARHLLAYNDERVPKTITAARPAERPDALRVVEHPPQEGATRLVAVVQEAVEAAGDPGEVAVLTRTNSLLLAPHVALHGAGVPIASVLRRDVLQRVGLRAALAWMRVATDPGSIAAGDLTEIRRRPSRGFPNWVDKWLGRCRSGHEVAKAAERIDDARVADKLLDLAADIDRIGELARGATTREVLQAIRDDIGLGGAMELLDGRPGAEGSSHLDDLDALLQVADLQPDPELFETWLRRALDGPRAGDGDPTAGAARGVTLSTVHRVKGREWPHVVVFGADAGIFPHRLAEDVEEERRVFHVAITRGIEAVTVLADDDRPSPFLDELDGTAPKQAPRRRHAAARAPTATAPAAGRGAQKAAARRSEPDLDGEDLVLFEELRRWRAEVARRQGGPAFIIFGDAPLKDIARARPADLRALSRIKGVGPSKLESYGDDVLEIVARFA